MGISLLTAPSHAEGSSSSKTSFRMPPSLLSDLGRKSVSSGEQMVQAETASEERTTALTNPSSPLRYTVGAAARPCSASPLLCLSENIQHGNLTPLLKIAEFTRFQLEVPLLKCGNGAQIPRLVSERQHVKPGEKKPRGALQVLTFGSVQEPARRGKAGAEKPPPRSPPARPAPRCPLPGRPLPHSPRPPRGGGAAAPRGCTPPLPRRAARRPQLQEPAPLGGCAPAAAPRGAQPPPPPHGPLLPARVQHVQAGFGGRSRLVSPLGAQPVARSVRWPPTCPKVTSPQGDRAPREQRFVLRLPSNDIARPPEELRRYLRLRHTSIWFAGQGKKSICCLLLKTS